MFMNTHTVKIISSVLLLSAISIGRLDASMIYTFAEDGAGVEVNYSGSLNTSIFAPQGAVTADERYINIPAGNFTVCDFENYQPSSLLPGFSGVSSVFSADSVTFSFNLDPLPNVFDASSSGGDTFGFDVFYYAGPYRAVINVPFEYISGSPINGSMYFTGETLSSMGIQADGGFEVYLPDGETISGIVVPEPRCVVLLAIGLLAVIGSRCRGLCIRLAIWSNKSPEPTAVGAVSSAFAVHVASRRWLSFLR